MTGTKRDFVIYDKVTKKMSKFSKTSPAYNRIPKKTKSGLKFTKITNKKVNNIQFPMIGR